jgi:GT2 family glycosyltransferase
MPDDRLPDPDLSVIICTRDRPAQVLDCLQALRTAELECPDLLIEVVLVENGSMASASLDVAQVACVAPPRTRLLRLERGGLSVARNHGMDSAAGALLAFVDDDCLVDRRWCADAKRYRDMMPDHFLLGGRVQLADPQDLPFTIKDVADAQLFHHGIHPGGFVQGCNFMMPKKTARIVGRFDPRFGAGACFRAGEDTDYIIRAHGAGVPVHYVPDMRVMHRHGRRTLTEIERLNHGYAHANGAILAKHVLRHPWLARHLLWTLRSAFQEGFGGPPFDAQIGLTWRAVARDQLSGICAFLRSRISGTGEPV